MKDAIKYLLLAGAGYFLYEHFMGSPMGTGSADLVPAPGGSAPPASTPPGNSGGGSSQSPPIIKEPTPKDPGSTGHVDQQAALRAWGATFGRALNVFEWYFGVRAVLKVEPPDIGIPGETTADFDTFWNAYKKSGGLGGLALCNCKRRSA